MSNKDLALRSMLNCIRVTNGVGPKPYGDRTLPMYTPRSNYSYAMESVVENNLAVKTDGSDMTTYTDTVCLTTFGVSHLIFLNKTFIKEHLFN